MPEESAALSPAAALLEAGGSHEALLRAMLRSTVPGFADWCVIDYYTVDGELVEIHSGYPDPEREQLILEIRRRYRSERGENGDVLAALRTGESLLYPDMSQIASVRLEPEQARLLSELGLRSSIVVPIHDEGRPLAVLSFLSTHRSYDDRELNSAQELAARCRPVLLAMRERSETRRSLALLDGLYATIPVGLGVLDVDLRFRRVNEHLAGLSDRPAAMASRTPDEVLGELGARLSDLARSVLADGQARTGIALAATVPSDPARTRYWLAACGPASVEGSVVGVSLTVQDTTVSRRSEARAVFLARAGEILDSSLDFRQTLERVARLAVPDIADWCSISMFNDRGQMYRLAIAHSDPAKDALAQELVAHGELLRPDAPAGAASAARSARSQLIEEFSDELLERSLADPRAREIIRSLRLGSSISVPLIARGRTLGALSLISEIPHGFGPEDLRLAEDLARRAAVQIDNARLYTERTRIARTLQAALRPPPLPRIPGVEVAARYRPVGELNDVGGDFYDLYPRSSGDWLLVIGDVTGKGADAAAVTAMVRYTLRAAAMHGGSPSELLAELNRAMLAQAANYCTIALVTVRPTGDGRVDAQVCLAGHPAPILLRPGGAAAEVGRRGTMLGYVRQPMLTDTSLALLAGDILVLYTDGLTEARPPGWTSDEVMERLSHCPSGDLAEMLTSLETAAVDATGEPPRDDIALLALRPT